MFHGWKDVDQEQVLHILKKLNALFTNQSRWLFWPLAENDTGNEVKPTDPSATKFSLMGASELFTTQEYEKPLCDFVDCALREYLNDLSGDDIVLGKSNYDIEILVIKMAIEELEK